MKKIIAIIRNPKEAKNFVVYCAQMAADLNASVDVCYFHAPEVYPMSSEGLTGATAHYLYENNLELEQEINKIVNGLINDINGIVPGNVPMKFLYKEGVFETLKDDIVKDPKNTMVAVEGRKEDMFATRSSSNMDIVAHANCPVWVIPEYSTYDPFKKIIYASDYNEADVETLSKIISLTKDFDPTLTALHISDKVDFDEKMKQSGFNDFVRSKTGYSDITVKSIVKKGKGTAAQINQYAAENNANLIVLLKENKSFLESVFKTSVTEKMSQKTMTPALIYHEG